MATFLALQMSPTDSAASIQETLQRIVKSAADWQANVLQRQGSNTGLCLRSNFLLMADIVVKQDRHLLLEDELQLLAAFKVSAFISFCCALAMSLWEKRCALSWLQNRWTMSLKLTP